MTEIIVNSKPAPQNAIGELLSYDPETGLLRWKMARGRCAAGAIAGYDTGRGYIGVRVNKVCHFAHRIAFLLMVGRFPDFVDHINGVRSDNRWVNLREVDRSGNGRNMRLPRTNKSGQMGVFWNSGKSKWTARIKVNQRSTHLGHFDNFDEAVSVRKAAERRLGFHANHGRSRG